MFRDLAKAGARVIFSPAAFTKLTGEAHWHILQRARAIENGCFIVSPAQVGMHANARQTYGHSLVVDPWGSNEIDRKKAHQEVIRVLKPGGVVITLTPSWIDTWRRIKHNQFS